MMADSIRRSLPPARLLRRRMCWRACRSDTRHWDARPRATNTSSASTLRCAVVFGRWRGRGVNGGQRFGYAARYVSVWVTRDGGWQMVSDQSTEIPPAGYFCGFSHEICPQRRLHRERCVYTPSISGRRTESPGSMVSLRPAGHRSRPLFFAR